MSKQLEIEFKNMLTKEEFQTLTKAFNVNEEAFHTQKNHYFDTADFSLRDAKSGLRIREVADRFECTLKEPAAGIGLTETTDLLQADHVQAVLAGKETLHAEEVHERLQFLNVSEEKLQLLGTLSTTRAEINYKEGLLVFDYSQYANTEDFELEYEVSNEQTGRIIFEQLLQQFHIPVRQADKKVARFVKAVQKQKGE